MEEDNIYHNIQKALENLPENFSILEERIDVEVQMKYFDFARLTRKPEFVEECYEKRDELFDPQVDDRRKKEILCAIASKDEVKAYRTIEKFVAETEGTMKSWAVLALQESRMLLQSSLLEEQQVFISTGLGGKGKMLRYFVVFINRDRGSMLEGTQQKLLKDELIFEIQKHNGEFESMDFMETFSTSLVILPLQVDIKEVFQNVVDECNQFGNFLEEDVVVTNVKVMSRGEILQLLEQNKNNIEDAF